MALMQRLSRRICRRRRSEPPPDTPPPTEQRTPNCLGAVADTSTTAMREALRLIKESSDAFPPLKSVAGGLDAIVTMVETMDDNVSSAIRLRSLVLRLSDILGDLANDEASIPDNSELRFSLAILDDGLQHIRKELDVICSEGRFQRFIRASKRRGYLAQLREDLNATASAYVVSSVTTIHIKIHQMDEKVDRLTTSISRIDDRHHLILTSTNPLNHSNVSISIVLFDWTVHTV